MKPRPVLQRAQATVSWAKYVLFSGMRRVRECRSLVWIPQEEHSGESRQIIAGNSG